MRRSVCILLAILFTLRSLVPAGFMLGTAADHGSLSIVICTGHGFETIAIDKITGEKRTHKTGSAKDVCPYAPVGAVAASDSTPALGISDVRYAAVAFRIARDVYRATPLPGAQSARGPPTTII